MNANFLRAYARQIRADFDLRETPSTATAEAHITDILYRTARSLLSGRPFGYHSRADMVQQAVLFGLEAIEEGYDVTRPLENFISNHMRKRLVNFRRDHFTRPEAPCECCEPFDPPAEPCERWRRWYQTNLAKRTLANPAPGGGNYFLTHLRCDDVEVEASELEAHLDTNIPDELRESYDRIKRGIKCSRGETTKVRAAVAKILAEAVNAKER